MPLRLLILLPLLMLGSPPRPAADLVITGRMHHLRSNAEREWAEFPERAEGRSLVLAFDAKPNPAEVTLRLRHRDLKQLWRVGINGREVARLPLDEADTISYWAVPPNTLADGPNELRAHTTSTVSDDVMVGEVRVIDRPAEQVLSEAAVDVSVSEEPGGRAIPSRITVANQDGTLVAGGNLSDPDHAVRPGVVYTGTGAVRLKLPAGRYVIYAGRGFEYSVARITVDLIPGTNPARRLSLRREVNTEGWAAMDTHLHTGTFAKHGDAGVGERLLTIAGEGIELPVSTEHNMRVDLGEHARKSGAGGPFTPIAGSEVTTPGLGHFNVFPIAPDSKSIDHLAADWVKLREAIESGTAGAAIVLNHGRDVHGGFRPLGAARHITVAGEDLAGWSLPANAMEVVNSGAVMTDGLALPRDWMGMLNRGRILTAVGSSDSHDVSRYIVGQGRTYVRCDDRRAAGIDLTQAMDSLLGGRSSVSYGLLTEIDVAGKGAGELVARPDPLRVHIRVQGPGWTRAERIALYVNGTRVREEQIGKGSRAGVKWEGTWTVSTPSHDVHLVAIASGPGVSAPYWPTAKPYQPTSLAFTPYVLGVSGAVFVDADRSGRFDSALAYARREVAAAKGEADLATRLGGYDRAVAVQAASLLRVQVPAAFEERVRSLTAASRPHVADGLREYLAAWQESQRASR